MATAWAPRVELVLAERHVAYERILDHILTRRVVVERAAGPVARRIGWLAVHQTSHPAGPIDELAVRLEATLMTTAQFGYREARREIGSLRDSDTRVTSAYQFPDAGRHADIARGGLTAIQALVRRRARRTAAAVAEAARDAATHARPGVPAALIVTGARIAASKALHNHVLELVGETLNLGRSAGVFSLPEPPQYAMRSEQLDTNTCDPCSELHGVIVEIGTGDYFDLMPPSGCSGGGRCRGVYVYGDEPAQVELAA